MNSMFCFSSDASLNDLELWKTAFFCVSVLAQLHTLMTSSALVEELKSCMFLLRQVGKETTY